MGMKGEGEEKEKFGLVATSQPTFTSYTEDIINTLDMRAVSAENHLADEFLCLKSGALLH